MMRKENLNFLDITFSLKDLLYVVSALFGAGLLTYQHNLIYLQNKQIDTLSQKLDELTVQHNKLISSINSLQEILRKRDLEFENLRNIMENFSTSEDRLVAASDPIVIQALTERYDFYLNIVKVVGCGFCVAGVVWLGFWVIGSVPSPWETVGNTVKGVAQKFGYMNDVENYYRTYENIYWKISIINKKDVSMVVKYPGSGEYNDAFIEFKKLLDELSQLGDIVSRAATQSAQQPAVDISLNTAQSSVIDVLSTAAQSSVINAASNTVLQQVPNIDPALAVINSLPF